MAQAPCAHDSQVSSHFASQTFKIASRSVISQNSTSFSTPLPGFECPLVYWSVILSFTSQCKCSLRWGPRFSWTDSGVHRATTAEIRLHHSSFTCSNYLLNTNHVLTHSVNNSSRQVELSSEYLSSLCMWASWRTGLISFLLCNSGLWQIFPEHSI